MTTRLVLLLVLTLACCDSQEANTMANNPFDREIINPLEKPLADDHNLAASYHDMSLRFFLGQYFKDDSGLKQDGFLNDGLKVVSDSPDAMSVVVSAGLGFQDVPIDVPSAIDSINGLNDLESYKPLPLFNQLVFSVPVAPTAPNTRIDIIEVKADRITTDLTSRQVFNALAGEFQAGSINKTLQFALDGRGGTVNAPAASTQPLSYKVGVAANPGVAPATTAGYIKIAEIAVGSDVVLIADADITDTRADLGARVSKIHWPASNGFEGAATTTQAAGGKVTVGAAAVWYQNIGEGLEAGDIIEDFITVVEKPNTTSSNHDVKIEISEVDLVAETSTNVDLNYASTGSQTAAKVYAVSSKTVAPANTFPYVWTEGSTATATCESAGADGIYHSTYAIVRRPLLRQDP